MPCGRLALIAGSSFTTAAAVSSGFAAGVGKTPMKVPGLAVEGDDRRRAPRAASSILRHVAQPHDVVALARDRQRAEGLGRLQRRLHVDVVGDELVLGLARRGEEVRRPDRRPAPRWR